MSLGHAEWIGDHSLGHRLWESGGHLRGRRDRRHHRPARAPAAGARAGLLAIVAALVLLCAARRARRAPRRAACCWRSPPPPSPSRWRSALLAPGKDYVLARNLMPALVPLLVAVGDRRHPAPRPPRRRAARRGCWSPTRSASRLGQPLARAAAARLGRGRGEPRRTGGAAGDGHLDPRRGLAALLPLDRLLPGLAVGRLRWCVHEVDFISDGPAPPPSRAACSARGFRQVGYDRSAGSTCGATRCPGPGWRQLRLRTVRDAQLELPHQRGPPRRHRAPADATRDRSELS